MTTAIYRCWAEIDRSALRHNAAVVRERIGSAELLAVVKADAYGHGLIGVAQALAASQIWRRRSRCETNCLIRSSFLARPFPKKDRQSSSADSFLPFRRSQKHKILLISGELRPFSSISRSIPAWGAWAFQNRTLSRFSKGSQRFQTSKSTASRHIFLCRMRMRSTRVMSSCDLDKT